MAVAPFCTKIHGIDINAISQSLVETIPYLIPFHTTTDDYIKNVLGNLKLTSNAIIDMAFIDACHESNQVFKDFEGLFPYVMEDGFIFLHDTYPYDECMIDPNLCNDCYQVPYLIKNKYANQCEFVTLPFNPGMTIIKKKLLRTPAFTNNIQ